MGVSAQDRANAVAFGDADVVQLSAPEVRNATQRGVRIVATDPVDFYALEFDPGQPSVPDARIREAVSLAVDRASLADVILQRQGDAAGGLLPNWLSGYAFLFSTARDLTRARDLLSAARAEDSRATVLQLHYHFSNSNLSDVDSDGSNSVTADEEGRAIAERVAFNLREAGVMVQLPGKNAEPAKPTAAAGNGIASGAAGAQLRLVRRHINGPDAQVALADLSASFGEPAAALTTAQNSYDEERMLVSSFRVIPLAYVSEMYGLGSRVRDWMAPRWGGWRLEDVWLAQPAAAGAGSAGQ
jgi:ABC-type oligopeptide transport system substrate-binding subunit